MVTDVLYAVSAWLMLIIGPATVTLLKGQRLAFAGGLLLFGMVWIVAACRLARPQSYWARRFYGPGKRARAQARYGITTD